MSTTRARRTGTAANEIGVYRVFYVGTWSDPDFLSLSAPAPSARELLLYLTLGEKTTALPGLLRAGRAELAEALGWPIEEFDRCFAELGAKGFARADWTRRVVLLPRELHRARPQSPNVVVAWSKSLKAFPPCDVLTEALSILTAVLSTYGNAFLRGFLKDFSEGFSEPSAKPSAKPSANTSLEVPVKASPIQKQKQDSGTGKQEQEAGESTAARAYQKFAATWTSMYGQPPDEATPRQMTKLAELLREHGTSTFQDAVDAYFGTDDDHVSDAKHPFALFIAQFSKWSVSESLPRRCRAPLEAFLNH